MPQVAAAVAGLDAARAARTLRDGGEVHVSVDGREHALGAEDIQLVLQPLEGYQVERAGTHAVALDLKRGRRAAPRGRWRARSCTRCRTRARRPAWTWRTGSSSALGGDDDLLDAVRAHEGYVTGETLATSLSLGDADGGRAATIEGRELMIAVRRV